MKILSMLVKTIMSVILILLCSFLATFFLSIFLPENVQKALEIFTKFMQIP